MRKNFDSWNELKKEIDSKGETKFYHAREIWWCAMGLNIGSEANGKGEEYRRPIIVIKGFNKESFLGVALTGKKKEGSYYAYLGEVSGKEASANLSQIRLFDTKRLVRKIGKLDEDKFKQLKDRITGMFK